MQPSRVIQRSGYNFESTEYDNCFSQAGLLSDVMRPASFIILHLTLMTWLPVVSTFLC